MTHIMRIDEFSLSSFMDSIIKRKKSNKEEVKPQEDGGIKDEKSPSEKMLEYINKNADKITYDNLIDFMKYSQFDDFNEKTFSDFKNAKWFDLMGDNEVDEFSNYIPVGPFNSYEKKFDSHVVRADAYRFSVTGENNEMDIMCVHYWDYPKWSNTHEYEYENEEEEEWENGFFIGIISKKTSK